MDCCASLCVTNNLVNEEAIAHWEGCRSKKNFLEFYLKNLNVLRYRNLTQYRQIRNTETMLNRRNCLWNLLYKTCALVEFYAA
jgi:hypothetical protein